MGLSGQSAAKLDRVVPIANHTVKGTAGLMRVLPTEVLVNSNERREASTVSPAADMHWGMPECWRSFFRLVQLRE